MPSYKRLIIEKLRYGKRGIVFSNEHVLSENVHKREIVSSPQSAVRQCDEAQVTADCQLGTAYLPQLLLFPLNGKLHQFGQCLFVYRVGEVFYHFQGFLIETVHHLGGIFNPS